MIFNPEWHLIGDIEQPIPKPMIDEVTDLLFAPDPPQRTLAQVEVCLVLGSRNCAYKAHRAAELFAERSNVMFVTCGANTAVTGQPEAVLIRDVLAQRGIAPERIILEEQSTNTGGNLHQAERLIAERLGDPRMKRVAVVSSGFHRLHVLASLPPSLFHSTFITASGPLANRDTWHTNQLGRAVILHELMRPGFIRSAKADQHRRRTREYEDFLRTKVSIARSQLRSGDGIDHDIVRDMRAMRRAQSS